MDSQTDEITYMPLHEVDIEQLVTTIRQIIALAAATPQEPRPLVIEW